VPAVLRAGTDGVVPLFMHSTAPTVRWPMRPDPDGELTAGCGLLDVLDLPGYLGREQRYLRASTPD
jgi:hypothetical protein